MSTRAANATIDELREELTAAQQRVAELRELLRECEYWLRGRLLSEHPLMVKVKAELAKGSK